MKFEELISYFGSIKKTADAIGVRIQVAHHWKKRGRIPSWRQKAFEKLTKGVLKIDDESGHIIKVNANIFLPEFRYFDDKLGMCNVFSLSYNEIGFNISYEAIESSKLSHCVLPNLGNLMQATSFYDKNQVRLYDKDIIRVENRKAYFFCLDGKHNFRSGTFEIIGNIFEGRKHGNQGSE